MSRSPNKLRIAITPSCIGVQSNDIWHEIAVSSHHPHHQPDLSELAQQLLSLKVKGDAEITLSARVAPTWLLPSPPVRLKQSEMEGWVTDEMTSRFGDLAESWQLSWDFPAPGESVLVAAVDLVWLGQLLDALNLAGATARTIQPWLSVAYRACSDEIGRRSAWLTLIEPGQISLAGFTSGAFSVLRNNTIDDQSDVVAVLTDMLNREALTAPEFKPQEIWVKPVQISADWRRLKNMKVHAAPATRARLAAMGEL